MSRKKQQPEGEDWNDYPFLTQTGIDLIKYYTVPRTYLGMGRYASYKEYNEIGWLIGYGSSRINNHLVGAQEKATQKEIDKQFLIDIKEFSKQVQQYVFAPLNEKKKGALLSFAHSLGLVSFKKSRLLDLINNYAKKSDVIREWSPYINRIWMSGGSFFAERRRVELNTYLAADKEIPLFIPHKCQLKQCLLNIHESFNGSPNQIKAIEYLERKLLEWDPNEEALRRFWRYWEETPGALGSLRSL